jgi:predicted HicB family RNase H-like nuclease
MTEKVLTVRLSEQDHLALELYAVLQGRSVNAVSPA